MKRHELVILLLLAGAVGVYVYLQQPTNIVNQNAVATAMNNAMGL
jgi:hypothetical protein